MHSYHYLKDVVAGTSETSAFDETSPSGNDYLAEVCVMIVTSLSLA